MNFKQIIKNLSFIINFTSNIKTTIKEIKNKNYTFSKEKIAFSFYILSLTFFFILLFYERPLETHEIKKIKKYAMCIGAIDNGVAYLKSKKEKDLTKILAIKENLELKLKKKRFYDHSDFETHYKSPYLFNSTQITGDSALPEKLRELAIKIEECDKSNL